MRESKIKGKVYRYDKESGKLVAVSPTEAELIKDAGIPIPEMDRKRVDDMTHAMMKLIGENFLSGPPGRERVCEALNALAICAGGIIRSCDDPAALEWFSQALNKNLKP